jgi:multiple sugar transport system permease protein
VPPPLFFSGELLNNIGVLTGRLPFWKNVGWSLYVGLSTA